MLPGVLREWLILCRSLRYGTLIFREIRRTNEGIAKPRSQIADLTSKYGRGSSVRRAMLVVLTEGVTYSRLSEITTRTAALATYFTIGIVYRSLMPNANLLPKVIEQM